VRHDKERRAGIKVVSVAAEAVAASTGTGILFEHGDVQTTLGQVRRGGDPA